MATCRVRPGLPTGLVCPSETTDKIIDELGEALRLPVRREVRHFRGRGRDGTPIEEIGAGTTSRLIREPASGLKLALVDKVPPDHKDHEGKRGHRHGDRRRHAIDYPSHREGR